MERKVTGMLYSYYFMCSRKLWYSANNIDMEQENDNVLIGRFLDERAYNREDKHILIDDAINIDFFRNGEIHEIKKSDKFEEMAVAQAKYYLYYLDNMGIEISKAIINYPLLRTNHKVVLTEEDKKEIEENITKIQMILANDTPPRHLQSRRICKKCAFHDICYI